MASTPVGWSGAEALRFLLMFFAVEVHRGRLEATDYRKEANRMLREQLGGRPPGAKPSRVENQKLLQI